MSKFSGKNNLATKDDLEKTNQEILEAVNQGFSELEGKMATKEDLKELRKDISHTFATKDDLKKFPTKDYIDKKINTVMDSIDSLAKEVTTTKEERISNQSAHNRIQEDVNQVRRHVGLGIKNPTLEPESL